MIKKLSGIPEKMIVPLLYQNVIPPKNVAVASVVTKDGNFSFATSIPLNSPNPRHKPIDRTIESKGAIPETIKPATKTPAKDTILAKDRSNSEIANIYVAPIATIISIEICCVIFMKFLTVKKIVGLKALNNIIIPKSAKSVPYFLISSFSIIILHNIDSKFFLDLSAHFVENQKLLLLSLP